MNKSVTFMETPETRLDDPPSYFQIFGAETEQPSLYTSYNIPPEETYQNESHYQNSTLKKQKRPPPPPPPPPYQAHFLSQAVNPFPVQSQAVQVEYTNIGPIDVKGNSSVASDSCPTTLVTVSDSDMTVNSNLNPNPAICKVTGVSRTVSMLSAARMCPPMRTTSLTAGINGHTLVPALEPTVFDSQNQNPTSDNEFKLNVQLFQNCIRLMALIFLLIIFFIVIQEFTKYYSEWKDRAFPFQYNTQSTNRFNTEK